MASPQTRPDAKLLAEKLGHAFAAPRLLEDALTHPSLAGANKRGKGAVAVAGSPQNGRTAEQSRPNKKGGMPYERLEFLGDRVLGLVIAEWLYESFPDAAEGEMAKRHAALVNREALRAVAREIGLGDFVRLARGEDASAARKNLATLPDAMEAVIGALYLDGGFEAARAFIRRFWQSGIAVSETPADPKTALQEWAQGHGLPLPSYRTVSNSGPAHAPKFLIEASVKGFDPVQAEGDSKRAAQKSAAALLLEKVRGDKKSK
ncbi:MAG: ribonuclease III [Alphaproteobacteria bacterium]|nr:ribonuclease III [Alphaproteobacteria bacterium]